MRPVTLTPAAAPLPEAAPLPLRAAEQGAGKERGAKTSWWVGTAWNSPAEDAPLRARGGQKAHRMEGISRGDIISRAADAFEPPGGQTTNLARTAGRAPLPFCACGLQEYNCCRKREQRRMRVPQQTVAPHRPRTLPQKPGCRWSGHCLAIPPEREMAGRKLRKLSGLIATANRSGRRFSGAFALVPRRQWKIRHAACDHVI
jgi:hypothetical protein